MIRKLKVTLGLIVCIASMYSCQKDQTSPTQASLNIQLNTPANFPYPNYNFEENVINDAAFTLGKKLFYEARLSSNGSISCGSCHQQFAAFANLDHKVSHGVNDCVGRRNAPPLFNLIWQQSFFWDGGVKNFETTSLNAILDECEMNTNLIQIISFLKNTAPYPEMFYNAFKSNEINSQQILKAFSQFMGLMVSANSKYDKVIRNENNVNFTEIEQQGYLLFKEKCISCHPEPFFTDFTYKNNGLNTNNDQGRAEITSNQYDSGKFRVPTLRNIEYTAPYMHDGRFYSINDVLDHYSIGNLNVENVDPSLLNNIKLSTLEKEQIKAFLKTLTDHEFIQNKIFSE